MEMGTKFKPLLRTNFSESENGKIFWNGTYSFEAFRRRVSSNLRTDKLVEFLSLNLVQMVKKFRIGILNFGTNKLYLNSWRDFGKRQCRIYSLSS